MDGTCSIIICLIYVSLLNGISFKWNGWKNQNYFYWLIEGQTFITATGFKPFLWIVVFIFHAICMILCISDLYIIDT
jgi:hypothetical protein